MVGVPWSGVKRPKTTDGRRVVVGEISGDPRNVPDLSRLEPGVRCAHGNDDGLVPQLLRHEVAVVVRGIDNDRGGTAQGKKVMRAQKNGLHATVQTFRSKAVSAAKIR